MLYSLFLQILSAQGDLIDLLFVDDWNIFVVLFRWFLLLNPSAHFCNAFQDVVRYAGNYYERDSSLWIK